MARKRSATRIVAVICGTLSVCLLLLTPFVLLGHSHGHDVRTDPCLICQMAHTAVDTPHGCDHGTSAPDEGGIHIANCSPLPSQQLHRATTTRAPPAA